MGFADHWNTRAEDLAGDWACDRHAPEGAHPMFRAVDVAAPPETVWRWLCQLRVAPYSYDWIDNRGRRSPPTLTPGLDRLEVGQTVMSIFRLTGFTPGDQLTVEAGRFLTLGPLFVTYRIRPASGGTRLAVKLAVGREPGPLARVMTRALAIGDWIMMRKQLLTLKRHAEASATAANRSETPRAARDGHEARGHPEPPAPSGAPPAAG